MLSTVAVAFLCATTTVTAQLCAPGGTSSICGTEPGTAPRVMDTVPPPGIDQAAELNPRRAARDPAPPAQPSGPGGIPSPGGATAFGQGPRRLPRRRGRHPRRRRPGVGLRRDAADAGPRQGRDPDPALAVVIRAARRRGTQPRHLGPRRA